MRHAAWLLCALVLAGCATQKWYRPDTTQPTFAQDRYDCLRQSSYVAAPTPYTPTAIPYGSPAGAGMTAAANALNQNRAFGGATQDPVLFRACMEAKGYAWR